MRQQASRQDLEPNNDPLVTGFTTPPDSAKPRVWWHWMNGNITQEGIEKDLQWMKRIGVGGLQNFDGGLDIPQVVSQRLIYMTPPWQDAFRYAVRRASELGLEFAIASSPGWSETGGPWVKPEDGMKKLVWSETAVEGGRPVKCTLPPPPSVAGPFQDIPMMDLPTSKQVEGREFYRDVAVVAFRKPRAHLDDPKPIAIRTSVPSLDPKTWLDEDSKVPLTLPVAQDQHTWVLYEYGSAHRIRAVSLTRRVPMSYKSSVRFVVETSRDGERFKPVAELTGDWHLPRVTVSFPAVTARFLRLTIVPMDQKSWAGFEFEANSPGAISSPTWSGGITEVALGDLRVYSGARIHYFEYKAGFSIASNYYGLEGPASEPDEVINPDEVIDLSVAMRSDGALDWDPPGGLWTVLRFGYSLTGKTNHPASAEATGLEVDKLDKTAVKAYMDHYLSNFERTVGKDWIGQKGVRAFLTDSIESAGQNWTRAMLTEFKVRRGYDLTVWLPALTGVIIGDATRTERFLWDFRRTLIELIAEGHYGQIAACVHARGMLYYSESLEGYPTSTLGDDLDMRAPADIPMAALWTSYRLNEKDGISNHVVDMIGAASVAHVFGKTFVGCESMTSANEPWAFSPGSLKPYVDLAFVLGINRQIIHTSVHQPVEKKPGMSLSCFGQHFTRHETWAEMAKPWISYLSRTSYLLQQGRFVADIAWFYGEEGSAANLVSRVTLGDFPRRYGFDLVSPNMLLKHLSAQQGRLTSEAGASYRLLYLGGSSQRMTLSVLRKLKSLADAGMSLAGKRPTGSPSLADDGKEDEYERLVHELWNTGTVLDASSPEEALEQLGISPDFEYKGTGPDSHVRFLHRTLPEGELYFVSNRRARTERLEARFRVAGRRPELWHADTGARERVSWRIETGHTIVPLELDAYQSLFVVFGQPTDEMADDVGTRKESLFLELQGDWQLTFEPERGAPKYLVSTRLGTWTDSHEFGIRYFSGIGTYRKRFIASKNLEAGARVLLDLGYVHELAEVTLNGISVGMTWHAPFRLDVTEALKTGINDLEIRVANLWVNRLIGDKQPGAIPVAFTVAPTYNANAPLRPSGLLGPVQLILST